MPRKQLYINYIFYRNIAKKTLASTTLLESNHKLQNSYFSSKGICSCFIIKLFYFCTILVLLGQILQVPSQESTTLQAALFTHQLPHTALKNMSLLKSSSFSTPPRPNRSCMLASLVCAEADALQSLSLRHGEKEGRVW